MKLTSIKGPIWLPQAIIAMVCLIFFAWMFLPVYQDLLLPIHAWAQADRLAIAFKFFENGFHFFQPQTYCIQPIDGVVGIELPLQAYVTALLGVIFGKQSIPLLFKLITLSLWLAAILNLSRLIGHFTQKWWLALLAVGFTFTSPLLSYYAFNYLPDMASLSLLIIGYVQAVYFLADKNPQPRKAYLAFWICVLAALTKLINSFYLPFLVLAILYTLYQRQASNWKKQIGFFAFQAVSAIGIILAYYLYIKHLQTTYDSYIFLSKPMLLEGGWEKVQTFLVEKVIEVWHKDYLSSGGYFLALIFLLTSLGGVFIFRKKAGIYAWLAAGVLLGGTVSLYLMGKQLETHGYYIINLIWPILLFTAISAVTVWGKLWDNLPNLVNLILGIGLSGLLVWGIVETKAQHKFRLAYKGVKLSEDVSWLPKAGIDPKTLPIPQDEAILMIAGWSPNQGLVYFQKDGLVIPHYQLNDNPKKLTNLMEGNRLRYLILSKSQQKLIYAQQACFFERFEEIFSNEDFFIYKLNGLKGWVQSHTSDTLTWFTDFENTIPCDTPSLQAKSGEHAIWVNDQHAYSYNWINTTDMLGLLASLQPWKLRGKAWISLSGDSLPPTLKIWVFGFTGNRYKRKRFLASELEITSDSSWQKVEFSSQGIEFDAKSKELSLFFNFPQGGKGTVFIDDLSLEFFPETRQP